MKTPKKRVPELRFKGFDGDWEQRKLGELITEHNELVTGYHFPIATSARTGLFFQAKYFDKGRSDINEGVTFHVVPKKFVTYRHMSDDSIFHFNKNTLDTPVQVSREYPVFTNNDKVNLDFLIQNLNFSGSFLKFSKMQKKGGTRTRLYYKVLQQYRISVPEVDEQDEISGFMKKIEKTIALHERKLDLLKELKKGYLQQLFPKNSDKTPQLRFVGFTGNWKQRKLGEVGQINPKTALPNEFIYISLESVVNNRLLSTQKFVCENAPSRAQRVAKFGDVFFQNVRPYQKNNYLFLGSEKNVVFSSGYTQIRSQVDSVFLLNSLQTKGFVDKVLRVSTGTSYPAVTSKDLGNQYIKLPTRSSEQNSVGKTFSFLDNLIAANEHKLDRFCKLKRAYLQKLFV